MGMEIERKFLVHDHLLPREALGEGTLFTQAYLALDPTVRVRIATQGALPPRAWLTIKGPGLRERAEFEYEIPAEDAAAMLPLCVARLTKTRHRLVFGAHAWDLDHFIDPHAGLCLAEVELSHPDEGFERPPWLGDEVTDDPHYANAALAVAHNLGDPSAR